MEKTIIDLIRSFVRDDPGNRLSGNRAPYFDEPLIGFASAADSLFVEYKRIIGPFHHSPAEILPGAKTVISWVLPISRVTRETNRQEEQWPSREWAVTRNSGEAFNSSLRRHLVAWLEEQGHRAVAPQLAPGWRQIDETPIGIASTWSERHAAYAAGLGTFSLNDGLITPRGIAHRLGSVITDLSLAPTPRTSLDYRHNCLWYRQGTCGACIGRCPAGALSFQGHNKSICRDYVYGAAPAAVAEAYGVNQTGCGLCQTRVSCEAMVPASKN
ncbi:iron-sulfur cluster-binding oxidoreductase [Geotalea daltonii FRC-32]|uniref:Iron-sulfur cluster-binding oxidoreductase n=1 Tax=Geotalea daltonii (strain DSM 22248 / JCM 15807 / FRC-32) TaxID=316067 RepID=B9M4P9_GEODF|nr:epoxyqueuosine reductase [Geotalea daltonii]ACM19775.1 iron-sulfur cluster-binding oxidoreductase [Geotalea daltonii FRC-32]